MTVRDTGTVVDRFPWVIVMVPLYVPACRFAGFAVTLNEAGVTPDAALRDSQLPPEETEEETVNGVADAAPDPDVGLVTVRVWMAEVVPGAVKKRIAAGNTSSDVFPAGGAAVTFKVTEKLCGEFGSEGEETTTVPVYSPGERLAGEIETLRVAGVVEVLEDTWSHPLEVAVETVVEKGADVDAEVVTLTVWLRGGVPSWKPKKSPLWLNCS